MKPYYWLRHSARVFLAQTLPGPPRHARALIVIGTPRSGTSWLARTLSQSKGVAYYYEPDRQLVESIPYYRARYLTGADQDDHLKTEADRMFHGKYCTGRTIWGSSLGQLLAVPVAQTVLLKWVWLVGCLEWLAANYPNVRVIKIVRHPIKQFLSWRDRGWTPNIDQFLKEESLTSGPLNPYVDLCRGATTYWQTAACFWGITTLLLHRTHPSGWVMKEHEWYQKDRVARVRQLFDELNLDWNDRIESGLMEDPHRKNDKQHKKFVMQDWKGVVEKKKITTTYGEYWQHSICRTTKI